MQIDNVLNNRVLAALPPHVLEPLTAPMKREQFKPNEVMLEEDAPIRRVYFPASGVISVVGTTSDGAEAEAYTIGIDGFFGAHLLLGAERIVQRTTCQIPGVYYSLPADTFVQLAAQYPEISRTGLRYLHCMLALTAQAAACNLLHGLTERCARWLLLAQDRTGSEEMLLTQDVLAIMLGVHRPSVTVAAGTLQTAGLIKYSRGRITVTDRAGLENASCECYRLISAEFDRYFPRQ